MGKRFSSRHFEICFLFSQKNRICHPMQIGDNLHEMSNPVFLEKRKEKCHQFVAQKVVYPFMPSFP